MNQCYLDTKQKRLKNPKVTDKEKEAYLLDAFGKRQICARVRQKKHTDVSPCWDACLDFFAAIKVKPFFNFDDENRSLYTIYISYNQEISNYFSPDHLRSHLLNATENEFFTGPKNAERRSVPS